MDKIALIISSIALVISISNLTRVLRSMFHKENKVDR